MVEVFKTNIQDKWHARVVITEIQNAFPGYTANFDLEDCDRILRIQATCGVDQQAVIKLINTFGYEGEVLSDEVPLLVN